MSVDRTVVTACVVAEAACRPAALGIAKHGRQDGVRSPLESDAVRGGDLAKEGRHGGLAKSEELCSLGLTLQGKGDVNHATVRRRLRFLNQALVSEPLDDPDGPGMGQPENLTNLTDRHPRLMADGD